MGKSKKHKSKTTPAEENLPAVSVTQEEHKAPSKLEIPPPPASSNLDQDFEAYYLQRLTAEFANDIDKIRTASDFHSSSIPMLVRALKQGAAGFSEADKRRIMEP